MEVGIDDEPDGVYRAIILREGYVREGKRTSRRLVRLTADDVAALAHEFYDHRLEIDTFLGRLYDAGGR